MHSDTFVKSAIAVCHNMTRAWKKCRDVIIMVDLFSCSLLTQRKEMKYCTLCLSIQQYMDNIAVTYQYLANSNFPHWKTKVLFIFTNILYSVAHRVARHVTHSWKRCLLLYPLYVQKLIFWTTVLYYSNQERRTDPKDQEKNLHSNCWMNQVRWGWCMISRVKTKQNSKHGGLRQFPENALRLQPPPH